METPTGATRRRTTLSPAAASTRTQRRAVRSGVASRGSKQSASCEAAGRQRATAGTPQLSRHKRTKRDGRGRSGQRSRPRRKRNVPRRGVRRLVRGRRAQFECYVYGHDMRATRCAPSLPTPRVSSGTTLLRGLRCVVTPPAARAFSSTRGIRGVRHSRHYASGACACHRWRLHHARLRQARL